MSDKKIKPLDYLGFQRRLPSAHLADFVECYWAIHRNTPLITTRKEFLYPEGGCGVIFNYGEPLLFDGKQPVSRFTQDGTKKSRTCVEFQGTIDAIGIRFKPGGASPFMQSPLHELKDQIIELEGKELYQMGHAISEKSSFQERIAGVENVLSELLLRSPNLPPQQFFPIIRAATNSRATVTTLAHAVGLSSRQLERQFKRHVGISPRDYLQFQRVEAARNLLKYEKLRTCTQIGLDVGFYDQSHFNRVFQSVVGNTPKAYRNRKRDGT